MGGWTGQDVYWTPLCRDVWGLIYTPSHIKQRKPLKSNKHFDTCWVVKREGLMAQITHPAESCSSRTGETDTRWAKLNHFISRDVKKPKKKHDLFTHLWPSDSGQSQSAALTARRLVSWRRWQLLRRRTQTSWRSGTAASCTAGICCDDSLTDFSVLNWPRGRCDIWAPEWRETKLQRSRRGTCRKLSGP